MCLVGREEGISSWKRDGEERVKRKFKIGMIEDDGGAVENSVTREIRRDFGGEGYARHPNRLANVRRVTVTLILLVLPFVRLFSST